MQDFLAILGLSLLAMFNPTLLAVTAILMLLPEPKRLMVGYLLGAYLTSITLGMLIVFELHGSSAVSTARHTLSPIEDLAIGVLLVVAGVVLKGQRLEARRERRKAKKEAKEAAGKKQSLPERLLGRGDPRLTFFAGVILTFPGASYLAALTKISKLDVGDAWIVLIVLAVCIIQQMLLELPIVGYVLRPEWTQGAVERFRSWLDRNGRRAAASLAIVLGVLLLIRGAVVLIVG
jgi:hypothetical protein